MSIWKYHIIRTLHWLVANNLLYKNIQINNCMLGIWEDKLILFDIIDSIIYYSTNIKIMQLTAIMIILKIILMLL